MYMQKKRLGGKTLKRSIIWSVLHHFLNFFIGAVEKNWSAEEERRRG